MTPFRILQGNSANLPTRTDATIGQCYITTDTHKMYIDANNERFALNAVNADTAEIANKLSSGTVGNSGLPVWFSNGTPQPCENNLNVNISGNAATATALTTNAGSSTLPVYFSGGNPVVTGTSLGVSITGNAKGLSYATALESTDAIDAFFTPSVLKVACLTSTASYADIGLTGNDGMIISIPWQNNSYGVQLAFDDNTNGLIKIRGRANNAWGTWKKILIEDDTNNYVKKTGDTMTGKLQVNHTIFSYQYTNSNNRAAFMLDKPGSGYTGIGANSESSTIYFGPCDSNGDWLTEPYQNWKFYGNIYAGGGNDNYGIHPWKNNYSTLGREDLYWWKAYVTYVYSNQVTGAVWNDYAEYRSQKEEIEPGYCVAATDDGKVYKTTTRLQPCDGVVSDTFGFSIGETDECKTPLAVAGRVLVYCEGDRNDYHFGDCVCAGPNGLAYKMTDEEICNYSHRIIGTVSEIPEYEIWGTGKVKVNRRIWIKVK